MKNQELIDYLESCGVCRVCQLRYLKARGTEYRDMQKTFERVSKTKKITKKKRRVAYQELCGTPFQF